MEQNFIKDISKYKIHKFERQDGELPVQAYLGTIYAKSAAGTVIEFYSYYDPDFKPDEYIYVERGYCQKIINATFHNLVRKDKIFFKKWDDFTMYCTDEFHRVLRYLVAEGFTLYV